MKRLKLIEILFNESMKIQEFKYLIVNNNEGSIEVSELKTHLISEPNFNFDFENHKNNCQYIQEFSTELLNIP